MSTATRSDRSGDVEQLEIIECRRCYQIFFLCHSCYRGQVYCAESCRVAARIAQHARAQQNYAATENGQERRTAAVAACRARQQLSKIVADAAETPDRHLPADNEQDRKNSAVLLACYLAGDGARGFGPAQIPEASCNRSGSSPQRSPMSSCPETARCCRCGRYGRVSTPLLS